MSSGKGVKQLQNQLFNGALFLLLSLQHINAEGNVGCLYSNQLCDKKTELCFNDNAFGRCVYKQNFVREDLYRFKFKYKELEKLKEQLEELKSLGFNWKHAYTQCIIQIQLQTFKFKVPYTLETCDQILKQEFSNSYQHEPKLYPDAIWLPDKTYELPQSVSEGIIKYEPDDRNKQSPNADSYYEQPTDYENELMNQLRLEAETKPNVLKKSMKSTSTRYRGTPLYLPLHNRQHLENEIMESKDDIYDKKYGLVGNGNWVSSAESNNDEDLQTLWKTLDMLKGDRGKTYTEGGPMNILDENNEYDNAMYDKLLNQYGVYGSDISSFQRRERLDVKKPGPGYGVNDYAFRDLNTKLEERQSRPTALGNTGETEEPEKKSYRQVNREKLYKEQKSEYEYVPNYGQRSENLQFVTIETNNRNLSRPLATEFLGTIRILRRLPSGTFRDLKVLNDRTIYFSVRTNIINYSANDISRIIGETIAETPIEGFDVTAVYVGLPRDMTKNEPSDTNDSVSCDANDSDYALLQLNKDSDSWMEADDIVRRLNSFFHFPPDTLYCIKKSGSDIAFKVRRNSKGLNVSTVVNTINAKKNAINKKLQIQVESVGIRSHDHPTILHLEADSENGYLKFSIIIFGVISAILVSFITLYAVKRQNKMKDKLYGLPRDKDLNKNHQDSYKNKINSKPVLETSVSGQRITSLSRESDNSPSSRSSTSSWSEDPMTNMDVTTGHMVLAYMEDHLTNKARLDTEWAALCAYDADPCSVAIAQQTENIRKNRYVNALPYDHARVVLNALSNVNGSDYINASTITDHDPRNPAYIATQGPLENTVCDFWQMLWEQGCNIVVMLTRLIENDTSMCYRYWPSEGVDLYNIYEVHLVSEHIWCDDFIVRSFYLKNQVTTETRTITQFHFLAWPEGGVPPAARSLLEFRRKVNKSFREKNHPIVVHCSDGVGRTGSYLLLDMVLNRISKGAKEIDIAATLEHIRDQRAGAVCTKQQFQFVLSAVAEEVQAVLKALPQQQQSAQDQNTDNVAPLVQLSTDSTDQTTPVTTTTSPAAVATATATATATGNTHHQKTVPSVPAVPISDSAAQ